MGGTIRLTAWDGDTPVHQRDYPVPEVGWATLGIDDLPTGAGALRLEAILLNAPRVSKGTAWLSIFDAPSARAFYADLHVHAHDTVGTNSPAYNAAYARDIGGIDVFGYTVNDFQITDANW